MIQRYEKIIRHRRVLAVLFTVVGAAMLVVLFTVKSGVIPRYMYTFLGTTSFTLIANGIVSCYRKSRLLRDSEALQNAAVLEFDERNVEVMRRSALLTLDLLLFAAYVAMIVAAFFSEVVCYTLLGCICTGLVIFLFCYSIIWKTT